jgi:cytoskeletal protein RodZ
MSEHDDIRRALEEFSSHPPMRDRKRAVHRRIAVVRRRHNIVGGVTLTIFLLFAGIAFAAIPTGRPQNRGSALQSSTPKPVPAPAPTPSPASSASSPAASRSTRASAGVSKAPGDATLLKNIAPGSDAATRGTPAIAAGPGVVTRTVTVPATEAATAPATSPAAPSTTPAKVTAGVKSASSSASSASQSGGSATGSPSISASTSPSTSASAAVEALAADVSGSTVDDGTGAPETTVVVRLHGSLYGSVDDVTVWYTTLHNPSYTDSAQRSCAVRGGALHPVDETYTFRTRYRSAGEQQVDVAVTSLDAACHRDATQRQWALSGKVTIPMASTLSNGVRPVSLFVDTVQVLDSKITLTTRANDADGFVSGFVVDWGTGAPQTFPSGNTANCSATENGGVFWPSSSGGGALTSPVLPPGPRTVTVTAASTGCDGTDTQTTEQKLTVTIPG